MLSYEVIIYFINNHFNNNNIKKNFNYSLLSEVLDVNELKKDQIEQEGVEGLMQNMTLDEKTAAAANLDALEDIKNQNLEACLERSYESSKIGKAITMINDLLTEFPNDKLIVVSQWTSILSIIARRLKKRHIEYCEIKGDVMLFKRNEIVESFNSKSNNDLKGILTYFFLFAHHKKYVFILKKSK